MDESKTETFDLGEPLIVRSHVMPWGFLVALPLALAFAYVGAWGLDVGLAPESIAVENAPLWIFSLPLLAFSLFLFLIGIGELARFLKPAVEVVVDASGVTTFGVLGARHMSWPDILASRIEGGQLSLEGRGKAGKRTREVRLNFNRLAIQPALLVQRISAHRPDLNPVPLRPADGGDNPSEVA